MNGRYVFPSRNRSFRKEENGKFFYDTKVEGEVLGETVDPFAEIPVDENGYLTIAFGTMILERV